MNRPNEYARAKASNKAAPWSQAEFEDQLRKKVTQYHTEHTFHRAMIEGRLTRKQIQGWVANRFYYQLTIPQKDAAILANCPDRNVRRKWVQRIIDQDGTDEAPGGLEGWIRLGEACGLSRDTLLSLEHVRPGVRFACDAYLNFARQSPWQEGICSSLTELFAHNAHKERIEAFPIYYPWIENEGLSYFRDRLTLVQVDVKHGLAVTLEYFDTRVMQERALDILGFKLDILWQILDSVQLAYGIGESDGT
ncbi:MAG: pyrroloquinoline-quinone synthase PqqC [Chitinophagaceae bacterium]|nr:pyrroloquinoline-quinone synthase PqqC [Oligoflexus sp.]